MAGATLYLVFLALVCVAHGSPAMKCAHKEVSKIYGHGQIAIICCIKFLLFGLFFQSSRIFVLVRI